VSGATILSLCQKGDELLEAETAKIFKGKKILKGSDRIRPSYNGLPCLSSVEQRYGW